MVKQRKSRRCKCGSEDLYATKRDKQGYATTEDRHASYEDTTCLSCGRKRGRKSIHRPK